MPALGSYEAIPLGGHPMTGSQAQPKHTVKRGESLWRIAEAEYGSGNAWRAIAQVNGITDPKHQRLTLPQLSQKGASAVTGAAAVHPVGGSDFAGIILPADPPFDGIGAAGQGARDGWVQFKYDLKGYKFQPIVAGDLQIELKLLGEVYLRPAQTVEGLDLELSPKDWSLKMRNLDVKGDAKLKNLESLARNICLTVFKCNNINVSVKTFVEMAEKDSKGKPPVTLGWSVNWESGKKGGAKSSFSVKGGALSIEYKYETTSELDFHYGEWFVTGSSVGYEIKITKDNSLRYKISPLPNYHPQDSPRFWPLLALPELPEVAAVLLLLL